MYNVILVIILLIFIICVVFIPLNVQLNFYREPNFRNFELLVKLWAIPIYYKRTQKVNWQIAPVFLLKQQQRLRASISSWHETGRILRSITRSIRIRKIYLYSELSLNDPAQTALAVGSTWWLIGIIHSHLNCLFNLADTENQLMILPNYRQRNYLRLDASCILELPLGHIMIILYFLLFKFRRIAKSVKEGCL